MLNNSSCLENSYIGNMETEPAKWFHSSSHWAGLLKLKITNFSVQETEHPWVPPWITAQTIGYVESECCRGYRTFLFVNMKNDWLKAERGCDAVFYFPCLFSGPPKHKPPPPVKAGSSTNMVSESDNSTYVTHPYKQPACLQGTNRYWFGISIRGNFM